MKCMARPRSKKRVTFYNKVLIKIYIREETRKEKIERLQELNKKYIKLLKLYEDQKKINNNIIK